MNMEENFNSEIPDVPEFNGQVNNQKIEEKLTVPFEDPSFDFFSGMFSTVKLALFSPTEFFSKYKMDGSIGKPILFAVIIGWFATAIALVWQSLFQASIMKMLQEMIPRNQGMDFNQFMGGSQFGMIIGSVFGFFIAPIAVVIGLFIYSAIYHLFLMIVKGANKGFETTFNVVAYGSAANLFKMIPIAGGLISMVYGIVIYVLGLSESHETEGWKGAFAVIAPIFFCCCCLILGIFIFAAGIGGLASAFDR